MTTKLKPLQVLFSVSRFTSQWEGADSDLLSAMVFLLVDCVAIFCKPFGTSESPKGAKTWRQVIACGAPDALRSTGPDPTRGRNLAPQWLDARSRCLVDGLRPLLTQRPSAIHPALGLPGTTRLARIRIAPCLAAAVFKLRSKLERGTALRANFENLRHPFRAKCERRKETRRNMRSSKPNRIFGKPRTNNHLVRLFRNCKYDLG